MAAPTASISVRCCRRAMVTGLGVPTLIARIVAIDGREEIANGGLL